MRCCNGFTANMGTQQDLSTMRCARESGRKGTACVQPGHKGDVTSLYCHSERSEESLFPATRSARVGMLRLRRSPASQDFGSAQHDKVAVDASFRAPVPSKLTANEPA